jgi:PAS domain S-box-containing protein
MNASFTILIVDDTPANRAVLGAQLGSLGFATHEAADGVEALAVLAGTPIDAVIADILMPRMDGYRLCQEIRKQERFQHLPVVVYTATYLTESDRKLALRSGADRYLVKPASLAELRRTLEELIRAPRHAPPVPAPVDDRTVMREYNAVLIQKLEDKTRELEAKNTELARVNAELEESRARATGIIESAMDAIVTLEHDSRIVLFNSAAEAMFGATASAMVGQPVDVLWPERFRTPTGHRQSEPDGVAPSRAETSARTVAVGLQSNGQEFPLEASVSHVEVAGRKLTTMILRDLTARHQAEKEIRTVSEQMRALALRLQKIREEERTRIAREIHDVLAQELTRLKIDLVWIARRTGKPIDDTVRSAMAARIADAVAQVDTAITTVQRIATELRPVVLDSLGLPAAVEWQAEDFARRTGIACHATTTGCDIPLDRERATALFRILQESLTNIVRHAAATTVDIALTVQDDHVNLTIRDNGRGINAAQLADPRSIGLAGMRERAEAFGGHVEIAIAAAGGTVVGVRLPLDAAPESPLSS